MTKAIPVCQPKLPVYDKLKPYLEEIDNNRLYSNGGPLLQSFEKKFVSHASGAYEMVATSNGTAAIEAAILAQCGFPDLGKSLCLMPSYTFPGSVSAVRSAGYIPHFVDVEIDDGMVDISKLIDHPQLEKVGLVLLVGAFGRLPDISTCRAFKDETGIPVIIDGAACADAFLSGQVKEIHDIPLTLSFHATKAFGIGEGGAVLGDNAAFLSRLRQTINFGFDPNRQVLHSGINGKLSEYGAAIGLALLDEWPARQVAMLAIVKQYHAAFGGHLEKRFWMEKKWITTYPHIIADNEIQRQKVTSALLEQKVGTRRWWGDGCHTQPAYREMMRDTLPNTAYLAKSVLGLPFLPDLSKKEIGRIAQTITTVIDAKSNGAIDIS